MLSVAFALNCGHFRTFMDAGKEGVYAEEGYQPMLQAFLDTPEIKFTLFFEGVTTKAGLAVEEARAHPAGKATRIIRSLDLALEARQLAQQAADAIGT